MEASTEKMTVVQGDIAWDRGMLVIPVNCVPGVMGAGLAKQFADAHPKAKKQHDFMCKTAGIRIGEPALNFTVAPQPVVFFPTKKHWRDPSQERWIVDGLSGLLKIIRNIDECPWHTYSGWHTSVTMREAGIAMPALGCGLGQLDWAFVKGAIERFAENLPDGWHVRLYRPHNSNE